MSAEIDGQGFASWMVDTPLDVVANTMGMLLPEAAHQEYARVVGNMIPGPHDPFEDGGANASESLPVRFPRIAP